MNLEMCVGEIKEEEISSSFDIVFPEKKNINEAADVLLKEYCLLTGRKATKHVRHERQAVIEEELIDYPIISVSPVGNLFHGKSDYFQVSIGNSHNSSKELLRGFRDQLEVKYS